MLADPKVSLFRPVPRHAVQRRQDAAEDARRRDVSESRARPHERRRLLLRGRARRGCGSAAGCGGRTRRSCSWCASTSSPTIAQLDAIVKSPGFKKLGGLQGDKLTRVPRGFAKDHPAAAYLQHRQFMAFREEPAAFATSEGFLQAAARHAGDDRAAGAVPERAAGRRRQQHGTHALTFSRRRSDRWALNVRA